MKHFFKNLIENKEKRLFEEGYDFAAGQLLRGSPSEMVDEVIEDAEGGSAFHKGGLKAIEDHKKLTEKGKKSYSYFNCC